MRVRRHDWLTGYGLGAATLSTMYERGVTIAADFSQIEQRVMSQYALADVQAAMRLCDANLDAAFTGRWTTTQPQAENNL